MSYIIIIIIIIIVSDICRAKEIERFQKHRSTKATSESNPEITLLRCTATNSVKYDAVSETGTYVYDLMFITK